MPKINPINVWISGKGGRDNHFHHMYETHVLADGTFQTLIPAEQVEWIERLDRTGVQLTKNKSDKPVLKAKNLDDISRIVHEYGRSTLEVETTIEQLIFYKVKLDIAYCTNPHLPGEVFPNGGIATQATGGDQDYQWHGSSKAGTMSSNGHSVGVSAVVVDKIIHRMSGGRSHVEHAKTKFPYKSTTFGASLNEFNAGVFPSGDYWSPTDPNVPRHPPGKSYMGEYLISDTLQFVPYTEEAAEFFYGMMMNLATLAERLRLFFGDGGDAFLENLNNGNAQLLLGKQKKD